MRWKIRFEMYFSRAEKILIKNFIAENIGNVRKDKREYFTDVSDIVKRTAWVYIEIF